MEAGRLAAGSGRAGAPIAQARPGPLRLDPFSLPVRFDAADEAADERLRIVDLHRERVVLRRSVRGMRMALNMPVAVLSRRRHPAVTAKPAKPPTVDRGRARTRATRLCRCRCSPPPRRDDIVAEWQCWGRVLGLPLLVAESDGTLREPFARLGALRIEAPTWRRRRRSAIARRRPSRLLRRRPGKLPATPVVHRGEREIIARN